MKKITFLILTSIFLTSCTKPSEVMYSGLYTWGAEVHAFKICNVAKEYWVSFDWAGIEMHEYYKAAHAKPYQPMYIEFRGQVLNENVDGFAEQYDGIIRVSEVKSFTLEVPVECK